MRLSLSTLTLLLTAAAPAAGQHTAPRNATVALEGASRMEIDAGPGSLRVVGQPGLTSVMVSGTARASHERLLGDIQLITERRGEAIRVATRFPRQGLRLIGIHNEWVALDLVITIPAGLTLSASDGSGDAEFRGTGSLAVRDGSGSLVVEDVMGEVEIHDGSGDLHVKNVTGPLTIHDGSGSIRLEGVGRDVTITDGSGDIVARTVGNIRIAADGSGNIDVAGASGSVKVDSDGSGSILVRDVGGDFVVVRAGSGSISHQSVRGRIDVPKR